MKPLGLQPNPDRSEVKHERILLIFPGALGDLLCLAPAIRALGRRHPGASIDLMARMELARFAAGRLGISRAYSIDRREIALLFSENREIFEIARFFRQFGRILSFFASDDARFREALRRAAGEGMLSFHAFRAESPGHVASAYLDEIGEPGAPLDSHLEVLPDDLEAARMLLADAGVGERRFAVLFPGSGGRHKNWPAENFVVFACAIRSRVHPLFVFGPAEEDMRRSLVSRLDEERISHVSGISLGAVAGLARLSAGFIGNDSGVSHLAAASGASGVVIFGPTDPARWRPLGRVEIVRAPNLAELSPAEVASTASTWI
jgi:heptosyltransferase III